jgi:hypothetical protein
MGWLQRLPRQPPFRAVAKLALPKQCCSPAGNPRFRRWFKKPSRKGKPPQQLLLRLRLSLYPPHPWRINLHPRPRE